LIVSCDLAHQRFRDEYLTRFLQLGQTSLRLIRVRRVGMFFYDLPIEFRGVRPVEPLLFDLRGILLAAWLAKRVLNLVRWQRARTGDLFKKIQILRIPRKLL
jgi:hypothetical protein